MNQAYYDGLLISELQALAVTGDPRAIYQLGLSMIDEHASGACNIQNKNHLHTYPSFDQAVEQSQTVKDLEQTVRVQKDRITMLYAQQPRDVFK